MRMLTVKLSEAEHVKLGELAWERRCSMSDLVRGWIGEARVGGSSGVVAPRVLEVPPVVVGGVERAVPEVVPVEPKVAAVTQRLEAIVERQKVEKRREAPGHVHKVRSNGPVAVCECGSVRRGDGSWPEES